MAKAKKPNKAAIHELGVSKDGNLRPGSAKLKGKKRK